MENRRDFIGGSDIAAVMGLSRYKTPLQLWAEKTGAVEPADLSGKECVQLGNELEDFVARKFSRELKLKVRRAPHVYVHPKYPFMRCQVDRLITGTDELLEVKTASAWKMKEWEGSEIPQEYILQVTWQLGITGRSRGWIAVLIGGQRFIYQRIDFDAQVYNQMIECAINFWSMVENNTPPMATSEDNEVLLALYPAEKNDEMLQTFQELENEIARRQELSGHIDELLRQKTDIDNKLKQVIGDNVGIQTDKYRVTWKQQATSPKVLFDQMKTDGVYDKYTQKNLARILRVRLNTKEGAQ